MPPSAWKRYQRLLDADRAEKAAAAAPAIPRTKPVSVHPIETPNRLRAYWDKETPAFDGRGWFGDGDNGHWHINNLIESKSLYSMEHFIDAMKAQGFTQFTLFEIHDDEFEEGLAAFMEKVAMGMCNQSMQHWTSFIVKEHLGLKKMRQFFGLATLNATEMLFLVLSTPGQITSHKVSLAEWEIS